MIQRIEPGVLALFACALLLLGGWPLQAQTPVSPRDQYLRAAKDIKIPAFTVNALPLDEALAKLSDASHQHDPKKKGVNFMIDQTGAPKVKTKVTVDLKNVTIHEAAEALAKQTGLALTVRGYAFVFTQENAPQ